MDSGTNFGDDVGSKLTTTPELELSSWCYRDERCLRAAVRYTVTIHQPLLAAQYYWYVYTFQFIAHLKLNLLKKMSYNLIN